MSKITKRTMLASLLGDNPNRHFTYKEISKFIKIITREAIYYHVARLRAAGMNIEVKNGTVTYMENQQ